LFANEVELRSSEAQNPSADVSADAESERSELQEVLVMITQKLNSKLMDAGFTKTRRRFWL